jgi:hypothetical protein
MNWKNNSNSKSLGDKFEDNFKKEYKSLIMIILSLAVS